MHTTPAAVVLGALFDFAGHLRVTQSINLAQEVDSFARLRQLNAKEVPTLTWRDQLNALRAPAAALPSDSELIRDLLTLAEAFKDGDPNAPDDIAVLLGNAVARLRRPATVEPRQPSYCGRSITAGHNEYDTCGQVTYGHVVYQCGSCAAKDLVHADAVIQSLQAELSFAQQDGERYRFTVAIGVVEGLHDAIEEAAVSNDADAPTEMVTADDFSAHIDKLMGIAVEAGLWPLKDGAQ